MTPLIAFAIWFITVWLAYRVGRSDGRTDEIQRRVEEALTRIEKHYR